MTDDQLTSALLDASCITGLTGLVLLLGGLAMHGFDRLRAWRRKGRRQRARLRAVIAFRRIRLNGWRANIRRAPRTKVYRLNPPTQS